MNDKHIESGSFQCSMATLKCPCCGNEVETPHRYEDGKRLRLDPLTKVMESDSK